MGIVLIGVASLCGLIGATRLACLAWSNNQVGRAIRCFCLVPVAVSSTASRTSTKRRSPWG